MPGLPAPSGRQYEIRHGDQRAVIVEVGGGLRSYETGDGSGLDGYGVDQMCRGGRGQTLIPWPNRIADGRYEFAGQSHQLALTEPEAGNAIHGLVRWANWHATEHSSSRVVMEHTLHPQPGWGGTLALQIAYELSDDGLGVATAAQNVGAQTVPYGAGAHPYLTLGTPRIDELVLTMSASAHLEADERGIPFRTVATAGTELDFARGRLIGAARLDTGYTELAVGPDGYARVRLSTEDGSRVLTLWQDAAYPYLMIFTGDTLAPEARRRGLAVEPMTCAPNAFASGQGLIRLEPGQSHAGRWGIARS